MANEILLYEIYFIKTLFISLNYGYNYKAGLWLFNIVDAKIPCPTTSRGTREKCHKGWAFCKLVKAGHSVANIGLDVEIISPINRSTHNSHIIILPLIKPFAAGNVKSV